MGWSGRVRQVSSWALALLVASATSAASGQPRTDAPESTDLPGPAAGLAQAVGLEAQTPRARLLLEVIRIVHATPAGQCPECDRARARLFAWLAAPAFEPDPTSAEGDRTPGGPGSPAPSVDVQAGGAQGPATESGRAVPLPLPPAAWRRLLRADAGASLIDLILRDRRASLLYYGLMGVDAATRDYLASHPDLLGDVYKDRSAAFAAFGRSFRVAEGRVVVPGGPAALPIWEDLVGERVADPEAFIRAGLGRSAGKLAYFLDTVAHLDAAQIDAVLAASERDPSTRTSRVRAASKFFTEVHAEWKVSDRPFARPPFDGSLVLMTVVARPGGHFAAPDNRRFWEAVFEGRVPAPGDEGRWGATVTPVVPLDAAWLLEQTVAVDPASGRDRLGAICFAQRLFGDRPAAQSVATARAARGFLEARTTMAVLERLGATDVALFDRAAVASARLSRIADTGTAAASIAQFQAALVLLERLCARRVIPLGLSLSLADALFSIGLSGDGRFDGGVARWLATALLPALPTVDDGDDVDVRMLNALAGRHPVEEGAAPTASTPTVTWEDVPYHVDVVGAELARLRRVRARQPGNPLDAALRLAGDVAGVAQAATAPAARAACDEVLKRAGELEAVSWPAPGVDAAVARPGELMAESCREIRDVRRDGDLAASGVQRAVRELAAVGDAVLADTLVAFVYALHVGDPAGAVDLAPDVARRHRFGLDGSARRAAWALPEERLGAGVAWHVEGALLGLEHGLAKLSLRLLFGQGMPPAPRLNDVDRRALALGLALLNPVALEDADRDAIVAALAAGRARLSSAEGLAGEFDRVAATAGWSEWRRETVRWALAQDPGSLPRLLTLADYFRAGAEAPVVAGLDAWGAATTPLDGDLRLAWPPARPWEELAGRGPTGQLMTRFVDLTLRVAEALAENRLPATLAAGTLASALADLIHRAPSSHGDDWYALARYAAELPEDRLLDYIAALAAGGPLVPVDEAQELPGP